MDIGVDVRSDEGTNSGMGEVMRVTREGLTEPGRSGGPAGTADPFSVFADPVAYLAALGLEARLEPDPAAGPAPLGRAA